VIAYANSIGGDYKAQPPLKVSPTPALAAARTTDPAHQHFCTWGFNQATSRGSGANDSHVQVTVERLPADKVQSACSLSGGHVRTISGIGDKAQATDAIGCVLVGDVLVQIGFDGATQNPTAPGDGVIDRTLRRLVTTVGHG
jgi:hypothetical protein